MTSPHHQQQDDNDSLYDHPIVKSPPSTKTQHETILPDEQAIRVDKLLDSEETPPSSTSNSVTSNSPPTQTLSENSHHSRPSIPQFSRDDQFDSDENQISTSSSSSSSSSSSTTTIPERPSRDNIPIVSSLDSPGPFKPAASFLSRASATFYKAFRKKKPMPPTPPPSHDAHARLVQLFDAQIATLRSARTGFVDLALVKPMTQRTLDAICDAGNMLRDFGDMERKVAELRKQIELSEREAEAEIRAKERLLVEAKVKLAEVSEEVEKLRHELRRVQKVLADPGRVDRKKIWEVRREALVCREARKDVERRLSEKTHELETEKSKLRSVEKDYRDIEGDWA